MTNELSLLRHPLSTSVDSITNALSNTQISSDVAITSFNGACNVTTGNEDKHIEKVMFNSNLMANKEANKYSMLTTSETIKIPTVKTVQDVLLFWNKVDPPRGLFLPFCSLDKKDFSGDHNLTRRLS